MNDDEKAIAKRIFRAIDRELVGFINDHTAKQITIATYENLKKKFGVK